LPNVRSQGDAGGQYEYGPALENGLGMSHDLEKTAAYRKMSAGQANADAQYDFGHLLSLAFNLIESILRGFVIVPLKR
jgi:TPR repeat protein